MIRLLLVKVKCEIQILAPTVWFTSEMKGLHLSKGQPQKEKWSFQNMEEVNRAASCLLRVAMLNERSKRWTKVGSDSLSACLSVCLVGWSAT